MSPLMIRTLSMMPVSLVTLVGLSVVIELPLNLAHISQMDFLDAFPGFIAYRLRSIPTLQW